MEDSRPEENQTKRFSELTRVGVTIGLVSFISITCIELLRLLDLLDPRWHVGVFISMGIGLLLILTDISLLLRFREYQEILRFYKRRYYWGSVLTLSAIVLYFFYPSRSETPPPKPHHHIIVEKEVPEPEPPPKAPPVPDPPRFPLLRVSAIVLNGPQTTATINGQRVPLGSMVEGVKLVAVTETNIVVELEGIQKSVGVFLDRPGVWMPNAGQQH